MKRIHFDTTDRNRWLKIISEAESTYRNCTDEQIFFNFDGINGIDKITPIHIVSLACLIESLVGRAAHVFIENRTNPVSRYLGEMLRFQEYWAGRQNFVQAQDSTIFNLWRIKDEEKELHSRRVYDYLKQNFFRHKDLSAVQNSLDEAYYNIFDHAQAANNAFSFIQFDEQTEKLHVAICDFGMGIARSVRTAFPAISNDALALAKAMEYRFTTGTQVHNMGMGLGNIKDTCTDDDILGIISNQGCLFAKRENIRTYENPFCFPGTLIYYGLSLSHFDDEEIIDNFTL